MVLKLTDIQKDVLRFLYAETAGETRRFVEFGTTYAYLVVATSSHGAIRWDAFGGVPPRFDSDRGYSTVRAAFNIRLSTVQALVNKELIQREKHGLRQHGHLTPWGRTVASNLLDGKDPQ